MIARISKHYGMRQFSTTFVVQPHCSSTNVALAKPGQDFGIYKNTFEYTLEDRSRVVFSNRMT